MSADDLCQCGHARSEHNGECYHRFSFNHGCRCLLFRPASQQDEPPAIICGTRSQPIGMETEPEPAVASDLSTSEMEELSVASETQNQGSEAPVANPEHPIVGSTCFTTPDSPVQELLQSLHVRGRIILEEQYARKKECAAKDAEIARLKEMLDVSFSQFSEMRMIAIERREKLSALRADLATARAERELYPENPIGPMPYEMWKAVVSARDMAFVRIASLRAQVEALTRERDDCLLKFADAGKAIASLNILKADNKHLAGLVEEAKLLLRLANECVPFQSELDHKIRAFLSRLAASGKEQS